MPHGGTDDQGHSFAEQLAALLLRHPDVSQNELARRLAKITGTQKEAKRRWIGKALRGEVDSPMEFTLKAIEDAVGEEGAFTRREVRRGKRAQLPSRAQLHARLRVVEGDLAFLEAWLTRGFAALGVEPELRDEALRSLGLGDEAQP